MKFIQKIQFWQQSFSRSYLRRIEIFMENIGPEQMMQTNREDFGVQYCAGHVASNEPLSFGAV